MTPITSDKTRTSYARDWEVWAEFHRWLAGQTGHVLPLTAVTKGTLVAFVVWLDEMKKAAAQHHRPPHHRGHGHRSPARHRGPEAGDEGGPGSPQADEDRPGADCARLRQGDRGHLDAPEGDEHRDSRPPAARRRRGTQELPELARLRDRALAKLAFGIAGRSEEVSSLDTKGVSQVAEGLEAHVRSVKGRPPRDVAVAYGENLDTCPVRCWLAWKEAAGLIAGSAFLPVDQKGCLGTRRLGPDGCRLAISRAA
ncbi:hypothetical protein ACWDBC_22125 [Streptomyces parvus]